ncbi:hypothetical protein [Methylobacterium sp. WL120]|uniref:hypothetical protein n=1 Tax=Methylobacterium sp. WL120 TaxID=2603887 RepID=UPI0011CB9176|nr:hypothetical protein [Methylobacterium sp. WL120]TXM69672.1 hypothetical protein FV229_04825 [Methylobacterium sp. WL120]
MIRIALASLALTAALMGPARADTNERYATALVATGIFVDDVCPGTSVDRAMMKAALTKLVPDTEAFINNRARGVQAALLIEVFKQNVTKSCADAWEMFGSDGTTIPGLLKR